MKIYVMIVGGGIAVVGSIVGVALQNSYDNHRDSNDEFVSETNKLYSRAIGLPSICVGVPLWIILNSSGNKKICTIIQFFK